MIRNLNSIRLSFRVSKNSGQRSCVTVAGTPDDLPVTRRCFGFFPKISTTVENTVENMVRSAKV
jgi:hypothetical protein